MTLLTLSFYLLREFQIYRGETSLTASFTPRLQSFIAYLLLHRDQTISRQQLAYHFWPNSTEAQARANLRKIVYRLRQAFPEADAYLDLDGAFLGWREGMPLRLDVADFEAVLQAAEKANNQQQKVHLLEEALALYKGDLLPDFYDDWLLPRREQLHQQYLHTLDMLAQRLEAKRDYKAAEHTVRRLLEADPLREPAYRRLMRLQALSDDVAGALRTYHRCVSWLEQELDVEPAPATQQVYRRLLDQQYIPEPSSPSRRRSPLVGREAAWQKLLKAWRAAAAGKPQAVLLSGEAGIGKTRLAEALLTWARRQGIPSLSAACYPGATQFSLGPVAEWLRFEQVQQVLSGLAPHWRSELARLLPELLAADPELEQPRPMTEAWQRQHFYLALAAAVTAVGEPLVLFLDDLHWADADTWSWLHFLAQQKGNHRFLFLATIRSEEVKPDHPLPAWQQTLARTLPVQQIALERLQPPATAALASAIIDQPLSQETAAALYAETEGNPLFTVEMVRAGLQRPQAVLPEKVRSVIEFRLNKLSPQVQEVAGVAAVIGRRFTFPLLAAASPLPEEQLLASLDELWQRQIIREEEADAYGFSHNKIREVTLARLSPVRRRWWHGRVAAALEQVYAGNLDAFHGRIAGHYEASGDVEKAVTHYRSAAEKAQELYGSDEAIKAYRRALDLLNHSVPGEISLALVAQRGQLLYQLGVVLALRGKNEEARAVCTEALTAVPAPSAAHQARLHHLIGDTYKAQGAYEQAVAAYERAEAVLPARERLAKGEERALWLEVQLSRLGLFYGRGESAKMKALIEDVWPVIEQQGSPVQRARFLSAAARAAVRSARYAPPLDEARTYYEQALAASREADDASVTATCQMGAGFIQLLRGDDEEAEEYLQAGLAAAEQIGYEWQRLLCLTYLSVLYRQRSVPTQTESCARQSLEVARAGGWDTYAGAAQANLAWVAWRAGDLDKARAKAQTALKLWRGSVYPFQWLALWLLIDMAVSEEAIEQALAFAAALLAPSQQRLLAPIAETLEAALQEEEPSLAVPHLRHACRLAREHRYL